MAESSRSSVAADEKNYDEALLEIAEQVEGFGGFYYSEEGDLVIRFESTEGLLRGAPGATEQLAPSVRDEILEARTTTPNAALSRLKGEVSARRVPSITSGFAFTDLYDWRSAIMEDGRAESAFGGRLNLVDIDEVEGVITLGVEGATARSALDEKLAELGIPVEAVVVVHTPEAAPYVGWTVAQQDTTLLEPPPCDDEIPEYDSCDDNPPPPPGGGGDPGPPAVTQRYRPVKLGTQIQFAVGGGIGSCTLGNVYGSGGGVGPGFITNDHCTAVRGSVDGRSFYQPTVASSNLLGNEDYASSPFSGYYSGCGSSKTCYITDGILAQFNSSSAYSGANSIEIVRPTMQFDPDAEEHSYKRFYVVIDERGYPTAGLKLNKVGRTTGWTSGNVDQTCFAVQTGGYWNQCTYRVDRDEPPTANQAFIADYGDSGSPVFFVYYGGSSDPRFNRFGEDVRLHGMLWGGPTSGSDYGRYFYFYPTANYDHSAETGIPSFSW